MTLTIGTHYGINPLIPGHLHAITLTILYIFLSQGHMQWLYDHKGKRYLDLFAGIVTASVGHCHP